MMGAKSAPDKAPEQKQTTQSNERMKSPKETYLELLKKVPVDDKEEFFNLKTRIHIGISQVKSETKRNDFLNRFQGSTSGIDFKGAPTKIFSSHLPEFIQAKFWGSPESIHKLIMVEEYNKKKAFLESLDMEIRAVLVEQGDLDWDVVSERDKAYKTLSARFKTKGLATANKGDGGVANKIKGELDKI